MNVEQVIWVRRLGRNGGARVIRESASVSASEVARELGVTPATVTRWELGQRTPRSDDAERWAELLRKLSV